MTVKHSIAPGHREGGAMKTPVEYWTASVVFWRGMLALHPEDAWLQKHLVFSIEQLRLAEEKRTP